MTPTGPPHLTVGLSVEHPRPAAKGVTPNDGVVVVRRCPGRRRPPPGPGAGAVVASGPTEEGCSASPEGASALAGALVALAGRGGPEPAGVDRGVERLVGDPVPAHVAQPRRQVLGVGVG